ncbi:MAG: hypothetical protein R3C15_22705 [Thermoleophilia bacterium]
MVGDGQDRAEPDDAHAPRAPAGGLLGDALRERRPRPAPVRLAVRAHVLDQPALEQGARSPSLAQSTTGSPSAGRTAYAVRIIGHQPLT